MTATKPRTEAATHARRVAGAKRHALEVSNRIALLPDWWLAQLGRNVCDEIDRRQRQPSQEEN